MATNIHNHTVAQLRQLAKQLGVPRSSRLKKGELIAAITEREPVTEHKGAGQLRRAVLVDRSAGKSAALATIYVDVSHNRPDIVSELADFDVNEIWAVIEHAELWGAHNVLKRIYHDINIRSKLTEQMDSHRVYETLLKKVAVAKQNRPCVTVYDENHTQNERDANHGDNTVLERLDEANAAGVLWAAARGGRIELFCELYEHPLVTKILDQMTDNEIGEILNTLHLAAYGRAVVAKYISP